jgi:hypothetical protein
MDFKVFKLADSRIVQVASKEKMRKWTGEAPLVYINYLRDNHLRTYGSKENQKEIGIYLDEAMQEIAIPKLIEALESPNEKEVSVILTNIDDLAKKKPDLIKVTLPYVERKFLHPNSEISKLAQNIQKNYDRAMKRRQIKNKLAENEKLGGTDAELDKKLVSGEITENQYIRLKKERIQAYQELEE